MARIHLDNFEAFLMDYVDSIVHQKEDMQLKQEIECFLNQHPSLREDFELVLAFSLHEKELLKASLPTEKEYYADKEKLKSIAQSKAKQSKAKERKLFRPIFYWAAACFLVLGLSVFVLRLYKQEIRVERIEERKNIKQEYAELIKEKPEEKENRMENSVENSIENRVEKNKENSKGNSKENSKAPKSVPSHVYVRESSYIAAIERRFPRISEKREVLTTKENPAFEEAPIAHNNSSIPSFEKVNPYLKEINKYISANIEIEKKSLKQAFRHLFESASRKYHKQKAKIENHFPSLFKSNEYYAFWEEKKENNK